MKGDKIIITIIAVLLSLSISFAGEQEERTEETAEAVQASQQKAYTSSGRLIYIGKDYIELKQGWTELIFYFNDSTLYETKEGETGGREAIQICQMVRVKYTVRESKNILLKVTVLKESNCVK